MTGLIIAGLVLGLVVTVGTCLALGVSLAIGRGERCDLERELADAHTDLDRISQRNQQLGDELAQARLDADMLRADVPDAATPELMAHVDDLPRRSAGACERELEQWADLIHGAAPDHGAALTPAEAADWQDLAARLESR